jgi:hypothetical protein
MEVARIGEGSMSIRYESLDDAARQQMIVELELDLSQGRLYQSPRLTEAGLVGWPDLLREASKQYDDSWLAGELRSRGYLRTHEIKKKPKGGTTNAKVPVTAADTLAEGEFNRLYCRGVCLVAIASGEIDVEVYRGKSVKNPRPASELLIGTRLPAKRLLDDLRMSQGVEPALGIPPGPNSGLSIRRCKGLSVGEEL